MIKRYILTFFAIFFLIFNTPTVANRKLKIKNTNTNISSERAKEIALRHSGIPSNRARFKKIKLDVDDGILVYELEFVSGNTEYEYSIDANTGRIVEFEIDDD